MIKNKKHLSSGFTLVEISMVLGISAVFLVLALGILNSFFQSRSRVKKINALQETTAYIFNQLTQEIHWSQAAVISDQGKKLALTFINPENQEEVESVFSLDANGRLLKNDAHLSSSEVIFNSFEVKDLIDEEDKVPCLQIKISLEYANGKPRIISENQTTISLRRYQFQSLEE